MTRFIAKVQSVSTQAERMTEPAVTPQGEPTPVALEAKGFVESTQEWVIAIVSMLFLTLFLLAADLASSGSGATPDSHWGRAGRSSSGCAANSAATSLPSRSATCCSASGPPPRWPGSTCRIRCSGASSRSPSISCRTRVRPSTLVLLTVVALVSFDGIGKTVSVAGTYLVLTTLEGQVLQPVLVGPRLDISPPLVLLGLWFGGWLWGVAGVALATPLLVSVKVAAQELSRAERDADAERRADTVRTRAANGWPAMPAVIDARRVGPGAAGCHATPRAT